VWHALYDPVRNCHYTHEHHDNPNDINDIFGPPGNWFGRPGMVTSLPWYADGNTGNPEGHEGYKWAVRRWPCRPASTAVQQDGCITAARILVHVNATAGAANVRFHGFAVEAQVQRQGHVGIMRWGGHLDTGHLNLQFENQAPLCPPLANNPSSFVCGGGTQRAHSGTNGPPGTTPHYARHATWYAAHALGGVAPTFDEFGPIDYQSPQTQRFFPGNPPDANGSFLRINNFSANTLRPWMFQHVDSQGLINVNLWVDRHGNPVSGCSAPARDCVPFHVQNVTWALHQITNTHDPGRDHDTSPGARGTGSEWWITPPN
jgi:hypothetical protein